MMTKAARLRLARWHADVWRFGTVPYAQRIFASLDVPTVVRPFFGYRLHLDTSRSNVQRMLFLQGERFLAEAELLRRVLKPGMRVVDVGANIGYYVLFIRHLIGESGHIIAIEPEPCNLDELRLNVTDNALSNVEILPIAVGDKCGEARLARGINGRVVDDGSGVTVTMRTLDSLLLSKDVDLLKMDIEGHEGRALAGADALLKRNDPTVFVEVHPALIPFPDSAADVLKMLQARYGTLEVYARSKRRSGIGKVLERYILSRTPRRVPFHEMLAACVSGNRREPFWVIGCNNPTRSGTPGGA